MKRRLMQQAAEAAAMEASKKTADMGRAYCVRFLFFSFPPSLLKNSFHNCSQAHWVLSFLNYSGNRRGEALWQLQATLGPALPDLDDILPHWPAWPAPDCQTAPVEDAKKQPKWQTALDNPFKFAFGTARPHRDLPGIQWQVGVNGIERSEAGAEGVFFVDSDDGAFVVKGSRSLASEAFAGLVSSELGVYGPAWRIVAMDSGFVPLVFPFFEYMVHIGTKLSLH